MSCCGQRRLTVRILDTRAVSAQSSPSRSRTRWGTSDRFRGGSSLSPADIVFVMPRADPILGLVVNPIAGMGGAVGLRGTDGSALERARRLGATPIAGLRTDRALRRIAEALPSTRIVAAAGSMGGCHAADLSTQIVFEPHEPTTAADTGRTVRAIIDHGVDLVLFAGGDGTARDVVAVAGETTPILGIPTGVKMHSAVFAATPEAAAEIAIRYLTDPTGTPLRRREVLDFIPDPESPAGFAPTPFAVASVPYAPGRLQKAKVSSRSDDEAELDSLCREIAAQMQPGRIYVIGPGTTTARLLSQLGLEGSTTGVDVVIDGGLAAKDANEMTILRMLDSGKPATLVLGVIGGQGFLLGRGNQQISPEVVRSIGEENTVIVAGEQKLRALDPPELLVDTGTDASEPILVGHRRVRTGPGKSMIMRVVNP